MGLWDAFKNLTKPYGEDELDDELEPAAPAFPRSQDSYMNYASAPAREAEQNPRQSFLSSVQRTVSAVKGGGSAVAAPAVPQNGASRGSVTMGASRDSGTPMKLVVLKPTALEDARECIESLRSSNTVVLDLEDTPQDIVIRVVDFISGAAYILGGRVTRLSTNTYLVTPPEVNLGGDVLASLGTLR